MRKQFSEQLRYCQQKLEMKENENFNQQVREQLFDHTISYLQEQFKLLFESVDNISIGKKAAEKYAQEINLLKITKTAQAEDIAKQTTLITYITSERDEFRSDTKELSEKSTLLEKQKLMQNTAFKNKITKLTDKSKRASEEIEKLVDKNLMVERQNKLVVQEKEKLKQRITKLI